MVVSGSSIVAAWRRGTTVLLIDMAYRSFGRFRQASTHLDTPPSSLSHHPISDIALTPEVSASCSGEAFRDAVPVQGAYWPADAGAAGARLRSPGHPWVLVASAGAA